MKRLIKLYIGAIVSPVIVLLAAFSITSCTQNKPNEVKDNAWSLALQINVPNSEVVSRSTEEGVDKENTIHSLHLYFFDNNKNLAFDINVPLEQLSKDRIFLKIKDADEALFNGEKDYTVYAVANHDKVAATNLEAFRQSVVDTPIGEAGTFVMVSQPVHPTPLLKIGDNTKNFIGTFGLKRLAVKVRLSHTNIVLPDGYTKGELRAELKNAVGSSYMNHPGVPASKGWSDVPISGDVVYTYSNDWGTDSGHATYLYLTLPIGKPGSTVKKDYYYKVPLDNQKILPNHLYDVTVNIRRLGSLDPAAPYSLNGSLKVKDWMETDLPHSDLTTPHYLVVAETYAEMKNVKEYDITFETSDPIEITEVHAKYVYVDNSTGKETEKEAGSPTITVDNNSKKINITSDLPTNYIPKTITFKVKHIEDVTNIAPVQVTIKQYPSIFITNTWGGKSSWRPDGKFGPRDPKAHNKAIYRVTTLVPNSEHLSQLVENSVLGFPPTIETKFYRSYYGYKTVKGKPVMNKSEINKYEEGTSTKYEMKTNHLTVESEEVANMISPNFEMASQLGATHPVPSLFPNSTGFPSKQEFPYFDQKSSYTIKKKHPPKTYEIKHEYMFNQDLYAHLTCAMYTETREDGTILDDWRVPTRAELKLINAMQLDSANPVKDLLTGEKYWSNVGAVLIGGRVKNDPGAVRCVRDVKE